MTEDEFLRVLLLRKNALVANLLKKNSTLKESIIDVIFFPGDAADPMIRIDGERMSNKTMAQLELLNRYVLVRDPKMAGSLSKKDFMALSVWAKRQKPATKSSYKYNEDLLQAAKKYLRFAKCALGQRYLWEIDCDDENIAIRVIDASAEKDYKKILSNKIALEVYKFFNVQDAKNLLLVRNEARKSGKPFFAFLNSIVNNS